ncbi:TraR/DksA family transcriptional regulator [Nocardioides dongxiaopingii]|uniref:TraR/DksA family transcriptional regulator n=1 Tax=Nocardioides dongxiaopingii TaxID=2576036 RepID=UPI0010C76C21|nr:TraR/DksA C4-type zinc finger protein [Nocardioides dongxiaopingii]
MSATEPTPTRLPSPPFRLLLDEAAATRQDQLASLSVAPGDEVAAAQRAALLQTLADIAAARRRLDGHAFGTCLRCRRPIAPERLEFRPWSATCVGCAGR